MLWLHASNAARFDQSVRDALDQLKVSGRKDPKVDALRLLQEWLRDERRGSWLVILDNADDVRFLLETASSEDHATATTLRRTRLDWLPQCAHGSVLVTSRSRGAALELVEDRDVVEVSQMDKGHAVALLKKKLGHECQIQDVIDLAEALEYMPLAMTQAAAYIRQRTPRCSARLYLDLLNQHGESTLILLDRDFQDLRRDREATNAIGVTWQISFEHFRQARPSAAELLGLMSFFDRQAIHESLIRNRQEGAHTGSAEQSDETISFRPEHEGTDFVAAADDGFEEDVVMLRSYSFIAMTTDADTFGMHRLVQLATRQWLRAQGLESRWRGQFVANLEVAMPTGDYENWSTCQALLPHVRLAQEQRPEDRDSLLRWAKIMQRAADFFWTKEGAFAEAERLQEQVVDIRKQKLGESHPDTLTGLYGLAWTYGSQHRLEEAERLHELVMNTRKQTLGEGHLDTLKSMGTLAWKYNLQGRWEDAEQLLVQVLKVQKQKSREDHPDTLLTMVHLASVYRSQGRLKEAERLLEQGVKAHKQKFGDDHEKTLIVIHILAGMYGDQGRWDEAAPLLEQVVETYMQKLGENYPDTNALPSIRDLAMVYRHQGRWGEAEPLQELALSKYTSLGRREEAAELLEEIEEWNKWKLKNEAHQATQKSKTLAQRWKGFKSKLLR